MKIKLDKLITDYKPELNTTDINLENKLGFLKQFYVKDIEYYDESKSTSEISHQKIKAQVNQLCDEMTALGLPNFNILKDKFNFHDPSNVKEAKNLNRIKESIEAILYLVKNEIKDIENFKNKYQDRQYHCNEGTLTNLQSILAEMTLDT